MASRTGEFTLIEQRQRSVLSRPFRGERGALFALLAGTILLRSAIIARDPASLQTDVDNYRALAQNLVAHGVYGAGQVPTAYRPPLYPIVLAPIVACGAPGVAAVATLHVALGVAAVWLVAVLGQAQGLGPWRFLGAALVACDPILLEQSTRVMSETLATFLVAFALVALSAVVVRPTIMRALAAGAGLGLCSLCRPTCLLWAICVTLALVWLVPREARRARVIGGVVIGVIALLAPWAIRNQIRFGWPIVTTTHGGFTLLLANNPEFYEHLATLPDEPWDAAQFNEEIRRQRSLNPQSDEIADDRREYALAWENIRHVPVMFVRAAAFRVSRLWGVLPMAIAGEPSRAVYLRYATAAWYGCQFALALAGLWCLGRRLWSAPWFFGLLLAVSFTLVHTLFWTDMRMRAPLTPVIALAAAAGAGWLWTQFTRRKSQSPK
jgi:4-amino-4-deoxy-L-arabinose transferase-like glycosyltransferase